MYKLYYVFTNLQLVSPTWQDAAENIQELKETLDFVQTLIYAGQIMEDSRPLKDYNVPPVRNSQRPISQCLSLDARKEFPQKALPPLHWGSIILQHLAYPAW